MRRATLEPIAAVATMLAAASARRDYMQRDRLSARTQAIMWPAYLSGSAVIVANALRAGSRGSRPSTLVGGSLALAGVALFVGGARPFKSFAQLAGRETGGLITRGIYRFSRNPQYVGNLLVSAGSAVAARSPAATVFTGVAAVAYRAYVPAEEDHLERTFGEEYRRYRERTPRWLGSPSASS